MHESYPAIYRDKYGEEQVTIHNNGELLTVAIRGVEFHGNFDSLEPEAGVDPSRLSLFTLSNQALWSYEIECCMPLPVMVDGEHIDGTLHVKLILDGPGGQYVGPENREDLYLTLTYLHETVASSGMSRGWFENELLEIQTALPTNTYMKACINCAFSDYSPGGSGIFGSMACFRGNKVGYSKVHSKVKLILIWDTMTELVQETYLCPEFERRKPYTGYRG